MAFTDQRQLPSPTGATLNFYQRKADGKAHGVVQINHGLAEHAARYARFADALAAAGYVTYAQDHRGHGHTTAPDAPPRRFAQSDGGDKVLADVAAVHDLIRRENPDLPLIVFGHSMGGMIALNSTLRHSGHLAGTAVWNSTFDTGVLGRLALAILAWERMRLGADAPSRILPRLTFQAWGKAVPKHRTLFDWLSRDPVEVDKYIADPLCGWDASVSMWRDLFGFIFAGADDGNFRSVRKDLPFLLVSGGKDPSNDGGKAMTRLASRMSRLGFSNLETMRYEDARHETLNDLNRDAATADFIAWADKVTGA